MNILLNEDEVREIIPQKMPMIMIDKLLICDSQKTVTSFKIKSDNILCRTNFLSEAGLIENMAQTCAARAGYFAGLNNAPVRVGFIGAVKNLKINFLPEINDEIITEIVLMHEIGDVLIIKAKIFRQEKIVAESELKIFLI
jgi:predicted hotdog family 3-hydroxylacyl-ACP dehydratase